MPDETTIEEQDSQGADDDVEAHVKEKPFKLPGAADGASDDGSDDVEAHFKRTF